MSRSCWIGIALVLSCLGSVDASAGISGRMMQIASTHPGHRLLESHAFIQNLRVGKFRREQIAQFFTDRIYLTKIMEKLGLENSALEIGGSNSNFPEDRVFFRSRIYQEELNRLMGRWVSVEPSPEAIRYGDYLQDTTQDVISIHLWLFLVGETFGAQHISNYIQTKFPQVGEISKAFEGIKLSTVRRGFNIWIEDQLGDGDLDVEKEVGVAYNYLLATFDAAQDVKNVTFFRSAMTVMSQLSFFDFGKTTR